MHLVYLETARPGLSWFRQYYHDRPELKWEAALTAYRKAIETLKLNPYAGKQFDDFETVFERKITRTAFSILYTLRDETIFVIDIRDQRGLRSGAALRAFTAELRRKHGLDES